MYSAMDQFPETFEDIRNLDTYLQIRPVIREYLKGQFEDFAPDCIVTIARKSKRLLDAVLDPNEKWSYPIKQDDDVRPKDIEGKRIVVFDDSLHTGGSVTDCVKTLSSMGDPADFRIVTILSNRGGLQFLADSGIPTDKVSSYEVFDSYAEQSAEYTRWMFSLVGAPKNKLGYEFVSETVVLQCDIDTAEKIITDSFAEEGYRPTVHLDSISDYLGVRNISYAPQDSYEEFDGHRYENPKVRMNLFTENGRTVGILEYMAFPEDVSDIAEECEDEGIRHRLCDYSEGADDLCRQCILLHTAVQFIERFEGVLFRRIRADDILFDTPVIHMPSKERYPERIKSELDASLQSRI